VGRKRHADTVFLRSPAMTTRDEETRKVLEDHRRLRKDLAELERLAAATPAVEERSLWINDLAGRIGGLRPRLEEHFDLEMASGFFEDIERAWPNAAEQCRRFIEDHHRYLDRLDGVLRTVAARPAADDTIKALAVEVRSIVEALRQHETRETELFQTALEGGPGALD
jgi:hypothetical protein